MRAYDIILKKRNGGELTRVEIDFLVSGYATGTIPDYQMSAFAMAVYFQGMTGAETLHLTRAMIESGETVSLATIPGVKVDKHSTGGVGDTTTLILAPLVAAAGAPVAKMSGRGLGHTGGTLDKLEAIPGFTVNLAPAEMIRAVRESGVAVVGQTANLVPADRMLYALRDVTATVDSLPLIAASIMSKKLAAGADAVVLDVKVGDGAFLKEPDQAFALAEAMVEIGTGAGRETVAVITAMDQPLGRAVGNALEVGEAIDTLKGEGPSDLAELCLVLGGHMLHLARVAGGPEEGREILQRLMDSGAALDKFRELVVSQGGDSRVVDNPSLLPLSPVHTPVKAQAAGYLQQIRAEPVGVAAMVLGAGRVTKDSTIDPGAGVVLMKKVGDRVTPGEELAVLYGSDAPGSEAVGEAKRLVAGACRVGPSAPAATPLVRGFVDRHGSQRC